MAKKLIIDVREPSEYAQGHVEGALNIPQAEIKNGAKQLADVPKDAQLVLYCSSGGRSGACKNALDEMGFTNVINGINKDTVLAEHTT